MSLTFFRALDRLLRMASALHPVISAISSVSYSCTSFICMMVRCRVGSELMISLISRNSSFSSSSRSGVADWLGACTCSSERESGRLARQISIQRWCVIVIAKASILWYSSNFCRMFHSFSMISCTASSASEGSSVNFRA